MKLILVFSVICFFSAFSRAQIVGVVRDKETNLPIVGAKILSSDGNKTLSDFEGNFILNCTKFPVVLITSFLQYRTDTISINVPGKITIDLFEREKNLDIVVVSAGRRKQAIE